MEGKYMEGKGLRLVGTYQRVSIEWFFATSNTRVEVLHEEGRVADSSER